MKKKPVKVSLIGRGTDNYYQIKFPNLKIPVNVNEELYHKMLRSKQYEFASGPEGLVKQHSAWYFTK